MRTLLLTLTTCLLVLPVQAKYSGGSGTDQDPYQIATAADLIALGETPADYDKHFILTADIDLDPNLPGRKVFDKAVIAPDMDPADQWSQFQGTPFTGVFDGNAHRISHLSITGKDYLGVFGHLGSGAQVKDLGVVDVNVTGSGCCVGGLVGDNYGGVCQCYSTGAVSGGGSVGGLVGATGDAFAGGADITDSYSTAAVSGTGRVVGGLVGYNVGTLANCYSTGPVSGTGSAVGGLVGGNDGYWEGFVSEGVVSNCYSTGAVSGSESVGGLVGSSRGSLIECCSTGAVTGTSRYVGGLVGDNSGGVGLCYSTGTVGGGSYVGGLVGDNSGGVGLCYSTGAVSGDKDVGGLVGSAGGGVVVNGFWDTQTSGQVTSDGGTGKTTAQMHDPNTFMAAGWDFVGQADGPHDIWAEPKGGGYPILYWQLPPGFGLPKFSAGTGELNDPYAISTGQELNSIGDNPRLMKCHFRLVADLDLTGFHFYPIGGADYPYAGVFDGNGHTISHLTVKGGGYLDLFGCLKSGAEVRDLGIVDVNITGSGIPGGLVGRNWGTVTNCYSSGAISGKGYVGRLVGYNSGTVTQCYSTGAVRGTRYVGGLVGYNSGTVTHCYSTGPVSGTDWAIGGLVGYNSGTVTHCHSTGSVSGSSYNIGGLVGSNGQWYERGGIVTACYSTGSVSGTDNVGGLVGENWGNVTQCSSAAVVSGTGVKTGGLVGGNLGAVTACYSTGSASGNRNVGGAVGYNDRGSVTQCYSIGPVHGGWYVGGLVGDSYEGHVTVSFWDTETSGQATSADGTGRTTAQMQTASTFLSAGWDFVGETANGTADIWWILEGKDYPRLWWELIEEK